MSFDATASERLIPASEKQDMPACLPLVSLTGDERAVMQNEQPAAPPAARKPIGKKMRFEVFKRDAFSCQYCGAHPPDSILHVDHIVPVALGGGNEIENLITACAPCNLGKGATSLDAVPKSLAEKAAEIAEREEQLAGYSAVLAARRERIENDVWRVFSMLRPGAEKVPRDDFASVKRFVEQLGVEPVLDAAEIALNSSVPDRAVFKYFCGVCWNKVREVQE